MQFRNITCSFRILTIENQRTIKDNIQDYNLSDY